MARLHEPLTYAAAAHYPFLENSFKQNIVSQISPLKVGMLSMWEIKTF